MKRTAEPSLQKLNIVMVERIKDSGVSYDSDHSVAENDLESGNFDKVENATEARVRVHFHWCHSLLPWPTCI